MASFASALFVGAVATGFQYIRVVPFILESEAFEVEEPPVPGAPQEPEEWAPAGGAERGAYTFLSNVLVSLAFSFLLIGLAAVDNVHVDFRSGLQRGVAGWTIFMALPCMGLSPELPGMLAAELTDRQWWWLYAVGFAGAGFVIALYATRIAPPPKPATADKAEGFERLTTENVRHATLRVALLVVAIVVAAVPHMTGAPHPHLAHGDVNATTTCGSTHSECERVGPPAEMAGAYAVWCLGTAFAYWLVLGVVASACCNAAMGFQTPMPSEVAIKASHVESALELASSTAASEKTAESV